MAGTVTEALDMLDVQGVSEAATGMVYHLFTESELPEATVRRICERVLCNPVIQYFEVYDGDGRLIVSG